MYILTSLTTHPKIAAPNLGPGRAARGRPGVVRATPVSMAGPSYASAKKGVVRPVD